MDRGAQERLRCGTRYRLRSSLIERVCGVLAIVLLGLVVSLAGTTSAAAAGVSRLHFASAAEDTGSGAIRWGPHNGPGPLDKIEVSPRETVASTFRSSSYTQYSLEEDTTLYHAYGGQSGPLSPFWSRTAPSGPLEAQLDLALNPAWGNTAETFSTIRVPAGTEVFEGFAGPQEIGGGGSLLGGDSQVYIPRVNPDWLVAP